MKFHVLSFASEVKDIVDITDTEISGDAENVIWKLMDFDYDSRTPLVIPLFIYSMNECTNMFYRNIPFTFVHL